MAQNRRITSGEMLFFMGREARHPLNCISTLSRVFSVQVGIVLALKKWRGRET
jgi:hypothetical protein